MELIKKVFKVINFVDKDFGFVFNDWRSLKIHLIDRIDDLVVLLLEFCDDSGEFFLYGPLFFYIDIEAIDVVHTDFDLFLKGLAVG